MPIAGSGVLRLGTCTDMEWECKKTMVMEEKVVYVCRRAGARFTIQVTCRAEGYRLLYHVHPKFYILAVLDSVIVP